MFTKNKHEVAPENAPAARDGAAAMGSLPMTLRGAEIKAPKQAQTNSNGK
jgi:hypothetical protein